MRSGDGIIVGIHYPLSGEIYNNTFIDAQTPYHNGGWIAHDVVAATPSRTAAPSQHTTGVA